MLEVLKEYYAHWIADSRDLKDFGRDIIIDSIKGRASIAVPSTTSITTKPLREKKSIKYCIYMKAYIQKETKLLLKKGII